MKETLNTLTHSSIQTFKECRRKFYYSYIKGIRPAIDKPVLRLGSAVHEGLDLLAKEHSLAETVGIIRDSYDSIEAYNDEFIQQLDYEATTACQLVEIYDKAWENQDIEIIESEQAFELPIINPETGQEHPQFKQAGKKDRICKLPDKRLALMETKTTSADISPGSDYRNMTAINQQVSMYMAACQDEGKDVQTCLYDCIRKPSIKPTPVPLLDEDGYKIVLDRDGNRVNNRNNKPRQTASKADGYEIQTRDMTAQEWREKLRTELLNNIERYYQRFEVARLSHELGEFRFELWEIAEDIGEAMRTGRFYRNTNSCQRWGSLCPYYEFCSGQACISPLPQGWRISDVAHEELEEV